VVVGLIESGWIHLNLSVTQQRWYSTPSSRRIPLPESMSIPDGIMVQTPATNADRALQVYLLGTLPFDDVLRWQRRLVYEVSGDRRSSVLVLCEHDPVVSVGREGSSEHIGYEPEELTDREWPTRWVNRGGGCMLHLSGQLAIYSIMPLDRLGLKLHDYLMGLQIAIANTCAELEVPISTQPDRTGVWSNGRLLAHIGVAVREWVTYFGATLNVHPDLELLRPVLVGGPHELAMTSLCREHREPIRDGTVRQRFVENFARQFGFQRLSVFHHHPALAHSARTASCVSKAG